MIETTGYKSSVVLKVWGNLDWTGSVSFRHVVSECFRPAIHVVIDLSEVEAVDGVGISSLVGAVRGVRAAGGSADIRNVPASVVRKMQAAGVCELLSPSPAIDGNDAASEQRPGAGRNWPGRRERRSVSGADPTPDRPPNERDARRSS